jgi:hypothetical protein
MTTGDVRAAGAALAAQLRAVRCPTEFSARAAETGSPVPLLSALGYVLLRFSKHVALLLVEQGVQVRCGGTALLSRRSNGARGTHTRPVAFCLPSPCRSCTENRICASWRGSSSLHGKP